MFNYDEYVGYSLLHWCLDHIEDISYGVQLEAQIRGEWKILASCSDIKWFYEIIGITVLDSAIVKCRQNQADLYWLIAIDLDRKGKFED